MAVNENAIKNMASEITRDCLSNNVVIELDFAKYLVELRLLNPKFGKLFSQKINRNNLELFVNNCVSMVIKGNTPILTMKMQQIFRDYYDTSENLLRKHAQNVTSCLMPLLHEIHDSFPDNDDQQAYEKVMRKISIYITLASGLGNPGNIVILKEGMAALESVCSLNDLKTFVTLTKDGKARHLEELIGLVSGVRLFNRDCNKGGEGIPDLPQSFSEAGMACISSVTGSLSKIMHKVNQLTSAIYDHITLDEANGDVKVRVDPNGLTLEDYQNLFDTLILFRQYEVYMRKLVVDVEVIVDNGKEHMDKARTVLQELHTALKYRTDVPVTVVFPLFLQLWQVWRGLQNEMFLIATINGLMVALDALCEETKHDHNNLEKALEGKTVITDQQRLNRTINMTHQLSLGGVMNYVPYEDVKDKPLQYLGFCVMSISVGALIPGNPKIGLFKWKGKYYTFSNANLAARFGKDPQRYIQACIQHARDNEAIINLLQIYQDVFDMKDIDNLVTKDVVKSKTIEKEIQTQLHPVPEKIDKDYNWNLWEHKKKACQWSSIVKCKTSSTQTGYSHIRSEIQCQTEEMKDKCLQTMKEVGTNVPTKSSFIWGLRGQRNDWQHVVNLTKMPED